jgi:hypothetical protein
MVNVILGKVDSLDSERKPTTWIFSTPIPKHLRDKILPGDVINGDVVDFIEQDTGHWHPKPSPQDSGLIRVLGVQAVSD